MIPQDIQSAFGEIQYHFETIDLLVDFDRIRETIPLTVLALEKMAALDRQAPLGGDSPLSTVDSMRLPKEVPAKELIAKLRSWSGNFTAASADELKNLQYEAFLAQLKSRCDKQWSALKKKFETPAERRMKRTAWAALGALLILAVCGFVYYQVMARYWGLSGEFFSGQNFEKKVDRRLCKQINFSDAGQFSQKVPTSDFSARFTGTLEVPDDGQYTFTAFSDDGIRFFIDGKAVINDWKGRYGEIRSAPQTLSRGEHAVKIEYFQAAGGAGLKLYWEAKKRPRTIIASKYLRPQPGDETAG